MPGKEKPVWYGRRPTAVPAFYGKILAPRVGSGHTLLAISAIAQKEALRFLCISQSKNSPSFSRYEKCAYPILQDFV
jgi:hypothetical protein